MIAARWPHSDPFKQPILLGTLEGRRLKIMHMKRNVAGLRRKHARWENLCMVLSSNVVP